MVRPRGAQFTAEFDLDRDVLWRAPIRISALAPGIVMDRFPYGTDTVIVLV